MTESGEAPGAWIHFFLAETQRVTRIRIFLHLDEPGIAGHEIRQARLTGVSGESQTVQFPYKSGWVSAEIEPIETDQVRLEVEEIYPTKGGLNWLELREVEFYGVAP